GLAVASPPVPPHRPPPVPPHRPPPAVAAGGEDEPQGPPCARKFAHDLMRIAVALLKVSRIIVEVINRGLRIGAADAGNLLAAALRNVSPADRVRLAALLSEHTPE
ncbi:MAG: hypothetical protein KJZ87_29125, partial [Thermoguttaceae bacterium]|nr:hypothetical protein [Thermoguttaceae bacterium]